MRRALAPVLFLAAALAAGAQESSSALDPVKLERLRKMSPEERTRLLERLAQLKRLPRAERERLVENLTRLKAMPADQVRTLREKNRQLTPEERAEMTELASGFFKWAHWRGIDRGFPRGLFFTWLKNSKPGALDELRAMPSGPEGRRVDRFIGLTVEFRNDVLSRLETHTGQHRCADPEEVRRLRDASPEDLWPEFQRLQRACAGAKARPGPVPPHSEGKPRK